jgi:hypothetical protein
LYYGIGSIKQGWPIGHPLLLPQDYVVDVYLSVRLEAGSLHVANYLIRATFYYLYAKVILFPSSAKHSCTPSGKHLLLHGVIFHHHPVVSGNVNVDCRGLESIS